MVMNMNLMVIIALVFLLFKIVDGYKKGMVKEIISFVSLIVMIVIVLLLGICLKSYVEKETIGIILSLLLLGILGIAHHLLRVVFFSAKMISKLPVIHWIDKLLGIVLGALETILVLWTLFTFIIFQGLGIIGQQILVYTQENAVLLFLYQHNYLAAWVEKVLGNIAL